MESIQIIYQHLTLFPSHKRKNTSQITKKTCTVYADDSSSKITVRKWIETIAILIKAISDDDQTGSLVGSRNNPYFTIRNQKPKITFYEHLAKCGFTYRYDVGCHTNSVRRTLFWVAYLFTVCSINVTKVHLFEITCDRK